MIIKTFLYTFRYGRQYISIKTHIGNVDRASRVCLPCSDFIHSNVALHVTFFKPMACMITSMAVTGGTLQASDNFSTHLTIVINLCQECDFPFLHVVP